MSVRPSARSPIPTARRRPSPISLPRRLSDESADISDRFDANERAEEAEQADPSERTEHAEPIDPMERTEPTEPNESTEPSLAIERIELDDRTDQREGVTIGAHCTGWCELECPRFWWTSRCTPTSVESGGVPRVLPNCRSARAPRRRRKRDSRPDAVRRLGLPPGQTEGLLFSSASRLGTARTSLDQTASRSVSPPDNS